MPPSRNLNWTPLHGCLRAALLWALLALPTMTPGESPPPAQPRIETLSHKPDGRVELTIRPTGDPEEVIDVYAAGTLTNPEWHLLAAYIFPEGEPQIVWSQEHPPELPAPQRYFQLGRADIDLNENGIPDRREALFHVYNLPHDARARWARAGLPPGFSTQYDTVLNVKDFGAKGDGVTDDTTAIQNAISQAPAQSVVHLPAGVYFLTQPIYLKPDMILRGDGPELTSLLFDGPNVAGRCIGIVRWDGHQPTDYVELTNDMDLGATQITVSSVAGFEPGDIVQIEEDNDPDWGLDDPWQARLPGQINRVIAVDPDNDRLTLDRHLRHPYTPQRNPRMRKLHTIENVGVESLFIQIKDDQINAYTIELKYAVNCWIRNVESYKTFKSHVWMTYSFECEFRENYFHDAHAFGGGGQGYGISSGRHTSDCLIEDNIFRHLRHAMIVGSGANGNVYGYNFSTQRAIDPFHGTPQPDISIHGNYVYMNLFEGNVSEDAYAPDWFWPAGPGNTLFRNRVINDNYAIHVGSDHQNFIGNVLPNGGIRYQFDDLQGIVEHGNVLFGNYDELDWQDDPSAILPDSFYRSVPPDFIRKNSSAWPPIGPDVEDAGMSAIPAGKRFQEGNYFP